MSDRDAAFDAAVREHGPALLLTAFHLTGDPDQAADVLETALAKASLRRRAVDVRKVLLGTALHRRPYLAGARRGRLRTGDEPDVIVEVTADELDEPALVMGAFRRL